MDTALWAATIIIVTVIAAATLAGWWNYRLDMARLKIVAEREAQENNGEGDPS